MLQFTGLTLGDQKEIPVALPIRASYTEHEPISLRDGLVPQRKEVPEGEAFWRHRQRQVRLRTRETGLRFLYFP